MKLDINSMFRNCIKKKFSVDYKNAPEEYAAWQEARRAFIGGSDADAFNPESKYNSPYLLYLRKKRIAPEFDGNAATRRGNLLEPVIRDETSRVLGVKVHTYPYMLISRKTPCMGCNLDGVILVPFEWNGKKIDAPAIFEAKTSRNGDGFGVGCVPDAYYYQVQHNMAVTGVNTCILSVYILNTDRFEVYDIPRDDEFIRSLVAAERQFWKTAIVGEVVPSPQGVERESEVLDSMLTGGTVEMSPELAVLCSLHDDAAKTEKESAEKKKKYANQIKAYLIDHADAESDAKKITASGDGYSVSYSLVFTRRVDGEKLKKNFPPIYESVTVETSSARLKVKKGEKK